MKPKPARFEWVKRPQLWVGLLATALVMSGSLWHPAQARPSEAWLTVQPVTIILPAAPVPEPIDCAKMACLALTFDDGPHAEYTPRILETLQRHKAKATFFVLGSHIKGNEALLKQIHDQGHEIGNHTWGHPYLTRLSLEQVTQEIARTQDAIIAAGVPAPQLFRPPYGDINDSIAQNIPLAIIRWNIDPKDWHPKHREDILAHMAAFAKPGGVVVLHDTEAFTADHLDQLLTQLEGQYKLVTISELFGLVPGQRGVYFGRN